MLKYLFFFIFGNYLFAQNVSTFFEDPGINIDDSMVFDSQGNLYGSNFDGNSVYKITPQGMVSTFATGLSNPNGLAFDAIGNLFIVEYSGQKIHKYDANGSLLMSFNINGTPSGLLKSFDSDTMIFTDVSNNSIKELAPDGTITVVFEGAPLNAPVGLTYDDNDNLFVGNFVGREVYKVGSTLEYVATVPDEGAMNDPFLGFIIHIDGMLYGTTLGTHKIYAINPNTIDDVTVFAGITQGSMDGTIAEATFDTPNGIVFNTTENALYVSEFSGNGNIRKIEDFTLSVERFELNNEFTVSPNPTNDYFKITGSSKVPLDQINISIYDAFGKLMSKSNMDIHNDSFEVSVDVSEYASGLYFLELTNDSTFTVSKAILKN